MISKQDILQIVHKVSKGQPSQRSFQFVKPMREWLVGLMIFSLLVIGVIVYDISLFAHYSSPELAIEPHQIDKENLKQATIDSVISRYEVRQEEFSRLRAFGQVDAVVGSEEAALNVSESDSTFGTNAENDVRVETSDSVDTTVSEDGSPFNDQGPNEIQ